MVCPTHSCDPAWFPSCHSQPSSSTTIPYAVTDVRTAAFLGVENFSPTASTKHEQPYTIS